MVLVLIGINEWSLIETERERYVNRLEGVPATPALASQLPKA